MPFTFSHPAIVLPLRKLSPRVFSLTGLVVGSITPDFEYFMRMKVKSVYSHSVLGLLWFDIPLGLLLTFIYHDVVRNMFIINLPGFLSKRLSNFRSFNWNAYFRKSWLMIVVSIVTGAASHLLWDSFTHPQGYFVCRISLLQKGVGIQSIHISVYQILQQLSSIVGGVVVIWAILSIKVKSAPQSKNQTSYWLLVAGVTLTVLGCRFFRGLNLHLYGDVIVTAISGFLLGIIITPVIFKISTERNAGKRG